MTKCSMGKAKFLLESQYIFKGKTKYNLGKAKKHLLVVGMTKCSMG